MFSKRYIYFIFYSWENKPIKSQQYSCLNKTWMTAPDDMPMWMGENLWGPYLDEELQAINSCYERENHSSQGMSPLIGYLIPNSYKL